MKNLFQFYLTLILLLSVFALNAQVTIYEHSKFDGDSYTLGVGEHNSASQWRGVGNDGASSIKVQSGYKAILFDNGGFSGDYKVYHSNKERLSEDNFNDKASSIIVVKLNSNAPVTIYKDKNYGGGYHQLEVGEYRNSSKWYTVGNDNISSIKVKPGYKAILYNNGDLSSTYRGFKADASYVGSEINDLASSIRVIDLNAPRNTFTPKTETYYEIETKKANNKLLDVSGDNLTINQRNGSGSQKFKFVPAGKDSKGISLYYMQSLLNYAADDSPVAIEIKDSGTSNGTKAICKLADEKNNQKFRIFDEGNGYVTFSPACGGNDIALDLYDGSTGNGSAIKVRDTDGKPDDRMFKLVDEGNYHNPSADRKTLFIYFNGSDKPLDHQLDQLGVLVDADIQIFVNGVGSVNDDFGWYNKKGVKFYHVNRRMNHYSHMGTDYYADFVTFKRDGSKDIVYGINRDYDGSAAGGYDNEDSKQICREVLKLLKVYRVKDIERIVISGHSRGSAVGVSSFLFALKNAEEGSNFNDYKSTVQSVFGGAKEINVIALDPVAGQTGNEYHMGSSWHIDQAYSFLKNKYNITFSEIYANAARMIDKSQNRASFNPAKKYLHQTSGVDVHRYWLGFRHSSMVNTGELMYQYYDKANIPRPIHHTAAYINSALSGDSKFRDKSYWTNLFFQSDLAAFNKAKSLSDGDWSELSDMYPKRHTDFKNQSGDNVDMKSFVGPHSLPW